MHFHFVNNRTVKKFMFSPCNNIYHKFSFLITKGIYAFLLIPHSNDDSFVTVLLLAIFAHSACLRHRNWCAVITHNPHPEFLTLPYHIAVSLYFLSL